MERGNISRFIHNTAQYNGWEIVKDSEFLGYMEEGLLLNFQRYGYLQCPCREGWGEREKDRDILCPCTYSGEDIEEYGHCYCGLFLSPDYAEKGEPPMSIPERRPEEYFP